MPKMYFRITARAKFGIAINRNELIVEIRSAGRLARAAVIKAHGIAIIDASNWAITRSVSDRGKRSTTKSLTGGWPVEPNCTPKSPVTMSPNHRTYRSGSGRSKW